MKPVSQSPLTTVRLTPAPHLSRLGTLLPLFNEINAFGVVVWVYFCQKRKNKGDFGPLRSADWYLFADVSGQPIGSTDDNVQSKYDLTGQCGIARRTIPSEDPLTRNAAAPWSSPSVCHPI